MFGHKDYNPEMYINPPNIIKDHRNAFEEMIGENIEEIWGIWEQDEDEWFNDCPVVSRFENCPLDTLLHPIKSLLRTFFVGDRLKT